MRKKQRKKLRGEMEAGSEGFDSQEDWQMVSDR